MPHALGARRPLGFGFWPLAGDDPRVDVRREDVRLLYVAVTRARREVEARLVAPLVEALGTEFGRDKVLRVIRNAVVEIARFLSPSFTRLKAFEPTVAIKTLMR